MDATRREQLLSLTPAGRVVASLDALFARDPGLLTVGEIKRGPRQGQPCVRDLKGRIVPVPDTHEIRDGILVKKEDLHLHQMDDEALAKHAGTLRNVLSDAEDDLREAQTKGLGVQEAMAGARGVRKEMDAAQSEVYRRVEGHEETAARHYFRYLQARSYDKGQHLQRFQEAADRAVALHRSITPEDENFIRREVEDRAASIAQNLLTQHINSLTPHHPPGI